MAEFMGLDIESVDLSRNGDVDALTAVLKWSGGHVRKRFSQGLTSEDAEEIVQEAFKEILVAWNDTSIDSQDVAEDFLKALERIKKRVKRTQQHSRMRSLELSQFHWIPDSSVECCIETRIFLKEASLRTAQWIREELSNLAPKDYNLVVSTLDLLHFFPQKNVGMKFPSREARRKARYRANKRFRNALESRLEKQRNSGTDTDLARVVVRDQLYREVNEWVA